MTARRLGASLAVGLVGSGLSIGRLWLANADAPSQVLWAEDGLFPLCVEKAGFLSCLVDPFAGYLLLAPRALAGIVAALPASSWAVATNVLAALLAGLVCALAFAWSRRAGLSAVSAVIVGLLPVTVPLVGVEAVNALGSAYMPLLFLATVVVALVPRAPVVGGGLTWAIALLLLLTALTIPLAALLLAVVAWQVLRGALPRRAGIAWAIALVLGTAAQVATALTAERPRAITIGSDSLASYFEALPRTMATLVGARAEVALDGGFTLPSAPTWLGPIAFVLVLVLGAIGAWRRDDLVRGAGLMALAGLAFGLMPSVIGWANNRYFVVPLLLWAAAIVTALDGPVRRWASSGPRRVAVGALVAIVAAAWAFGLPASQWRATPAPPWQDEVARVVARCVTDPAIEERPIFSPFWPPNWGDGLSEPTHPNFPCVLAWGWQ